MAEKVKEEIKISVAESPKYSVMELAKAHNKLFETTEDIVTSALINAGRTEYTVAEAKKYVGEFRKKVIK